MGNSVILTKTFIKGKLQELSPEAQSLFLYLCATVEEKGIHRSPYGTARYLEISDECVDEIIDCGLMSDNLADPPLCEYKIYDWTEYNGTSRNSHEYNEWKQLVKERDGFKCVECGAEKNLVAHHIKSYKDYPALRLDVDNGVTLCDRCHRMLHKYGNKKNS